MKFYRFDSHRSTGTRACTGAGIVNLGREKSF